MRIRQGQKCHQNFRVYVKLTLLCVKIDGVVFSVHGGNFQCYFTGLKSFSGILWKSQSFDATEPIFPLVFGVLEKSNSKKK